MTNFAGHITLTEAAAAVMSARWAEQCAAIMSARWAEQSAAVLSAGWAEECSASAFNNHRYYRYC